MEHLLGKSLSELQSIVESIGCKPFVAKQISHWLYVSRVTEISQMSNLSKHVREQLGEHYDVGRYSPIHCATSLDGTKKYLFEVSPGLYIESVYIPDGDRATLCVSTQIGCRMGCRFCFTGQLEFKGQLSVTDIINQIFSIPESNSLTNIVYMGMGEPFDNIDNVLCSLLVLTSDWGCSWSGTRITVSTVGIIDGIERFLRQTSCHLAISLHNPFDDERKELMPAQNKYPLSRVLSSLDNSAFVHQRRLSFEYIVFSGYNDTLRHARELVRLLRPLRCRVNLIRYHGESPNSELHGSNDERIQWFSTYLNENGVTTTIRRSRGEDIMAACGMLVAKGLK